MYDELTKNDIKKMQAELDYRKAILKKELLEEVKQARAQGDLSENFEYKSAKQEKNKNESRMRYLEKMINTAKIIEDEAKEGIVGMNDTVELFFEDEGESDIYKIVTAVRFNSLENRITKESPLGAAIYGHKVGDTCIVNTGDYKYTVRIMKVEHTGDEDDTIREY